MSLELKRFLLNSYPSFGGENAMDPLTEYSFRVDEIEPSDDDSESRRVHVRVTGLDRFCLRLTNSPINVEIDQLVKSKGGEIFSGPPHSCITLTLDTSDSYAIVQLSSLIRTFAAHIRARSVQKDIRMWERTADSLARFAALISQYDKQTRGMEKTRPDGLFAF